MAGSYLLDLPRRSRWRTAEIHETSRTERVRRVLNIAVALFGIIITLPLCVLIAVLVRLTSRGPVLYRQTRVGIDRRATNIDPAGARRARDVGGRPFTIYKFRTMKVSRSGAQLWAQPDDARVTAVGRVLRKFRLDELPQLVNVLRGDMNVVGPRPEQPDIFAHLRNEIGDYGVRQRVLPGITGWAQVNLNYDQTLDDVRRKLMFDLEYLERRSAVEDTRIMLLTLPVMLGRRGAL
ncbi:MAG: sugar transferase [Gemmatimonadaceae bacterium]|nr:sugar transferase [Gemmatimonadaceae bacterium]